MKEGIDFNDTFAPVAKPTTLRALLSIAAKYNCKLKSGDVETAFLTASMDCVVYIKLPPYWGDSKGPVSAADGGANSIRILLKGVPGPSSQPSVL
jgi:hypothetical protein